MNFLKLDPNKVYDAVQIASINPDSDTAAETIRSTGGTITYATVAAALAVASGDAADTTQTVTITGLNGSYVETTETVTLTGTTPVNTTTTWLRVFSVTLSAACAGAVTVGANITIAIGDLSYTAATYTVPANKFAYLVAVRAHSIIDADIHLRVRPFGGAWRTIYSTETTELGGIDHKFAAPLRLDAKSDIDMQCVNGANSVVHGGFELWLVN